MTEPRCTPGCENEPTEMEQRFIGADAYRADRPA